MDAVIVLGGITILQKTKAATRLLTGASMIKPVIKLLPVLYSKT